MFTLEQIDAIHTRLGKAQTLLQYVRALNVLGVVRYESFVIDGHSEYFGAAGQKLVSPPAHHTLSIAATGNRDSLLHHLKLHEQGKTTYLEMSKGLAGSGIEKWTVDTASATMTFADQAGNALLVEMVA